MNQCNLITDYAGNLIAVYTATDYAGNEIQIVISF